jgi:hypothetical protein
LIGCMRSSNCDDGLNFHLRMIVQIIPAPPTDAAITMNTVSVVRFVVDVALVFAAEEALGDGMALEMLMTVTREPVVAATLVGASVRLSVSEVGAGVGEEVVLVDEDELVVLLEEADDERLAVLTDPVDCVALVDVEEALVEVVEATAVADVTLVETLGSTSAGRLSEEDAKSESLKSLESAPKRENCRFLIKRK